MKLNIEFNPDIVALMKAEVAAGEKAVSAAMREAGTSLKSAWRGQITGAGLGRRLANSIRSQTYPKAGESLNAAALVWSKAPVIVGAHDTGPLIRSKDGFWLAIPTPAAGRGLRAGASREDAFRKLADSAAVDEIRSFTTLLIQSDKLGTSITATLRVYAAEMREIRRMKAEERAHRLPVLISIPLVACLLPVMIGVLMLPAVVRLIRIVIPLMTGG